MHHKFKIDFIDLVRPETYSYFGLLDAEKVLLTYQWMVSTANRSYEGVYELLTGQPTCRGWREVEPLGKNWKSELATRFRYIFLSGLAQPGAIQWRTVNQIDLATSKVIHARYCGSDSRPYFVELGDFIRLLDRIFQAKGTLVRQLNPFHEKAREVKRVQLEIRPEFRFILKYGFPDGQYGAEWTHVLATQEKNETLPVLVKRVLETLDQEVAK